MAHQSSDSTAVRQQLFDLYKENFYLENCKLAEDERNKLWMDKVPTLASFLGISVASNGGPEDTKRVGPSPMLKSKSEQLPPRKPSSKMYREHSARSNTRILAAKPSNIGHDHALQVSQSLDSRRLQPLTSSKCRRTNSGHRLSLPMLPEVETAEFSPQEYLKHASSQTSTSSPQEAVSSCSQDLSSQIQPAQLWSSQDFATLSPSSTYSGESSPSFSSTMSRQCSLITNSISNGMDMIRIHSEGAGPFPSQDYNLYSTSLPNTIKYADQLCPTMTYNLQPIVPSVDIASSCPWPSADPMKPMNVPQLETNVQYKEEAIKKRPLPSDTSSAYNSKPTAFPNPLIAVKSVDGKEKCAISRSVAARPQKQKLMCPNCSKHPDGFRGDHELRRHIDRAHAETSRKVWICIDSSPGQVFLSNCKACTRGKTYGAYYNAAAHLRRVHFNPKGTGPKVKGIANRAGKGGGNYPPMEHLKSEWIREIDEQIDPTFNSNSEDDSEESSDEPTDSLDLSLPTSGYVFSGRGFAEDHNNMPLYQPCPTQHTTLPYASNFSFTSPSNDYSLSCGQDALVLS